MVCCIKIFILIVNKLPKHWPVLKGRCDRPDPTLPIFRLDLVHASGVHISKFEQGVKGKPMPGLFIISLILIIGVLVGLIIACEAHRGLIMA
jgi:hypothetical protein